MNADESGAEPDGTPALGPGIAGDEQPTGDEVLGELNRVLASRVFRGAKRSREFLSYVVSETVAGRGHRLSERTVGRHGLDHGDDFDGRFDASVRVRASRTRKSLQEYYATEGAQNPIRIELMAGSYEPTFTWVSVPSPVATDIDPGVLVMLFEAEDDGSAPVALAISETLVERLACFPGLRVVGPATSMSPGAREVGQDLDVRYVMHGTVDRRGDTLRLGARLTDATSGEVMWAVSDTVMPGPHGVRELVGEWVAVVAGELGDYAGVILPHSSAGDTNPESELESAARMAFYAYIIHGTNAELLEARRALVRARDAGFRSPAVLGMYSSAVSVSAAYGLTEDREADLADAEATACEALEADASNAHAQLCLATIALVRGQWGEAIHLARQGARMGAGHPTLLTTAGTVLALAGAWTEGVLVMREALRLNPRHPGYVRGLFALDRVLAGDDSAALAEASLMHTSDTYWGPFYRALALAGLGYLEQSRREFSIAVSIEPTLATDPASVLGSYANFTDAQLAVLVDRVALIQDSVAAGTQR